VEFPEFVSEFKMENIRLSFEIIVGPRKKYGRPDHSDVPHNIFINVTFHRTSQKYRRQLISPQNMVYLDQCVARPCRVESFYSMINLC